MKRNANKKADGVIGGLIGLAVGWFGDTTATESHRRENPRLNEHERHESKHMLRDITENSGNEAAHNTVVKHKNRPNVETPNVIKAPSGPKSRTQENERIQIQGQLNELYSRRDQLLQTKGDATYRGGKISKNADYHDTEEQLGIVDFRIKSLEGVLENSHLGSFDCQSDFIEIGSTVVLKEDGSKETEVYKIVSSTLVNARGRNISANSPIGSELLNKQRGEKVHARTPDGISKFTIVDIR